MAQRLNHEFKLMQKRKDLANFVAVPDEKVHFDWYFLIFGLEDCSYAGGYYVGKLTFPKDYPFKPPGI